MIYADNILRAGDILIFGMHQKGTLSDKIGQSVIVFRNFFDYSSSNNSAIHAAICVGANHKGEALMAHIILNKTKTYQDEIRNGHHIHSLKDIQLRDGEIRDITIFRPLNEKFAKKLAKTAASEEAKNIERYDLFDLARTLKNSTFGMRKKSALELENMEKSFGNTSFCSKFVIKTLKKTAIELKMEEFYPCLRSDATSKAIEAELSQNENFQRINFYNFGVSFNDIFDHLPNLKLLDHSSKIILIKLFNKAVEETMSYYVNQYATLTPTLIKLSNFLFGNDDLDTLIEGISNYILTHNKQSPLNDNFERLLYEKMLFDETFNQIMHQCIKPMAIKNLQDDSEHHCLLNFSAALDY